MKQDKNSDSSKNKVNVTSTKDLVTEISAFAIIKCEFGAETSYKISHDCWEEWEDMEKFSKRQVIKFFKDFLRNYKKKKKEEALWSEEVLEAIKRGDKAKDNLIEAMKTFKESKEN